jgi:aspartate racemase
MNNTASSFPLPLSVGILAGMGPAAGVDFARLFLQACEAELRSRGRPIHDRAYPEHWLAQIPVADRSAALDNPQAPQPLAELTRTLQQLATLGAQAVAIACNTAHAWHAELQARVPQLRLLHIAQEAVAALQQQGQSRAILLATQGSYRNGIYQQAFAARGMDCVLPDADEQQTLMQGIYQGVKAGRIDYAQQCFSQVGQSLQARHGALPLLMACTEIPLALPAAPAARDWQLVDASAILAAALARAAYGPPPARA